MVSKELIPRIRTPPKPRTIGSLSYIQASGSGIRLEASATVPVMVKVPSRSSTSKIRGLPKAQN